MVPGGPGWAGRCHLGHQMALRGLWKPELARGPRAHRHKS